MSELRDDPRFQEILQSALTRRTVLRGAGATGLAAFLAACGVGETGTGTRSSSIARDMSDTEKIVRWANWPAYVDYDSETKKYPTLERFQKSTGIKATYSEDIDGNDTYYAKIQGQLKNGQDFGKDIVVLSDRTAGRMIRQGYVQELDRTNIPNATNLVDKLQQVEFDPGRRFTLTWQSGFAGIGYRKDKVGRELRTIEDLWAPDLKGRVVVLDEMTDTVGLLMQAQGADVTADPSGDAFMKALSELEKQIKSGQIRQVKGNSYIEDLRSGNAIAAIAWSGDLALLQIEENDPNFTFTIPESGGIFWSDNLLVPTTSPHKKNAERLMDFYYDPRVAAEVAAYVNYICPVEGAQQEMEKIDPSLVESPLIFPTEEDLSKVSFFRPLSAEEESTYSEAFQKVIGF